MSLVFQICFQPAPVRPWVCAFARPPRTCVAKRGSQPESTSDQLHQPCKMPTWKSSYCIDGCIFQYISYLFISSFDAIKIGRGPSVGQKLMTFVCFFYIDSYWHGLCSVDDLMWLCSPWVVDEWFYFLLLCLIPNSSKKTKWRQSKNWDHQRLNLKTVSLGRWS